MQGHLIRALGKKKATAFSLFECQKDDSKTFDETRGFFTFWAGYYRVFLLVLWSV